MPIDSCSDFSNDQLFTWPQHWSGAADRRRAFAWRKAKLRQLQELHTPSCVYSLRVWLCWWRSRVRYDSLPSPPQLMLQEQNNRRRKHSQKGCQYSREMDTAQPGKHTRILYDALKRSEASILATTNRHGTRLEQQNRTNVPAGKQRNHQTLPVLMYDVDNPLNANATANGYKKRQPVLLLGGKEPTEHGRGPRDNQLRNSHQMTRNRTSASSMSPHFPTNPPQAPSSPASLASFAEDRTLNTWRNSLQTRLQLRPCSAPDVDGVKAP